MRQQDIQSRNYSVYWSFPGFLSIVLPGYNNQGICIFILCIFPHTAPQTTQTILCKGSLRWFGWKHSPAYSAGNQGRSCRRLQFDRQRGGAQVFCPGKIIRRQQADACRRRWSKMDNNGRRAQIKAAGSVTCPDMYRWCNKKITAQLEACSQIEIIYIGGYLL